MWSYIQRPGSEDISSEMSHYLRLNGVPAAARVYPDSLVDASTDMALDLIGAFCAILRGSPWFESEYSELEDFINELFEDHRVAFRVVDAEVIPVESDELHTEVVLPALRLLVGGTFTKAHSAYLDALKQLPTDPSNAITDAGTALQEALTALGCKGNALGPLITNAHKSGLLASHDSALTDGVMKFLHWASANRSEAGDSHRVSDASRADAWLMVHIVGALIVKLAADS